MAGYDLKSIKWPLGTPDLHLNGPVRRLERLQRLGVRRLELLVDGPRRRDKGAAARLGERADVQREHLGAHVGVPRLRVMFLSVPTRAEGFAPLCIAVVTYQSRSRVDSVTLLVRHGPDLGARDMR